MIEIALNNGEIKKAVFAGTITDMLSDLFLEISLLYGSVCSKSKGGAEMFRAVFMAAISDHDFIKNIFNTEVYESLVNDKDFTSSFVHFDNPTEFMKQLQELLNEDE